MANVDIPVLLHESFLGVLPEQVQADLAPSARILELPTSKLIYDPQVSIIAKGAVRAFVDDGSGRHLTVSLDQV